MVKSSLLSRINERRRKGSSDRELVEFLSRIQQFEADAEGLLPILAGWMNSKDSSLRKMTIILLERLSRVTQAACPLIFNALEDPDYVACAVTISSIGRLKNIPLSVVMRLVDKLEHQESFVQKTAAFVLGNFKREEAIPKLLKLVQIESQKQDYQRDRNLLRDVLIALAQIRGAERNDIAPEILQDEYFQLSFEAGIELHPIDLDGEDLLFKFSQCLKHKNRLLRLQTIKILREIKHKIGETNSLVSLLLESLKDPIPGVRLESIKVLKEIKKSKEFLRSIIFGLIDNFQTSDDDKIRLRIISTLPRMPEQDEADEYNAEIIQVLIQALKDEKSNVRTIALIELTKFGPKAHQAIPFIKEALGDKDNGVQEYAHKALKAISSRNR